MDPSLRSCLHKLQPTAGDGFSRQIDVRAWHDATSLVSGAIELGVRRGEVSVTAWHHLYDGRRVECATLTCAQTGAAVTPPMDVALMAQQGAVIEVEVVAASEDADFDLWWGSDDTPSMPEAKLAVVVQVRSKETAKAAVDAFVASHHRYGDLIGEHACHLVLDVPEIDAELQGRLVQNGVHGALLHQRVGAGFNWLRRAVHSVAYGDLSTLGVTHLAVQPRDEILRPEGVLHAVGLSRFLQQNWMFHAGAHNDNAWPHILVALAPVFRHGLPNRDPDNFAFALEDNGLARVSFTGPPPAIQTPRAGGKLKECIARFSLREPTKEASNLGLKICQAGDQIRDLKVGQNAAIARLERQLREQEHRAKSRALIDQDRANRKMLSVMRNRHHGARAVIVGNGPSLQISDLERLRGTVTFASNKIWLAYEVTDWRPTYYSIEDHLVLESCKERVETLEGSVKIFPSHMRDYGYNSGDTLFSPFLPPRSFEDPLSDSDFPHFSHDLSHGLAWGSSIVYSQIQMALFMGCREIVVIGVDHCYTLPAKKRGNTYIHDGEINHFHPDYRRIGEAWHQPNLAVLDVSFKKARVECEKGGARVLNASRRTKLTAFERADFDVLFPPVREIV